MLGRVPMQLIIFLIPRCDLLRWQRAPLKVAASLLKHCKLLDDGWITNEMERYMKENSENV